MRTKLMLAAVACSAACACAEEIVFFQSSTAGSKAWLGDDAIVAGRAEGAVAITENSPTNTAGNAAVADRLPFFPAGSVVFDVEEATKGDYTLQVLGFKGDAYLQTVTPVSHLKEAKRYEFMMSTLNMPETADAVVFKVWVAGADAASAVVRELRYSAAVNTGASVLDERFKDADVWMPDSNKVALVQAEGAPAQLSLLKGVTYGSITYRDSFSREPNEDILVHVAAADKGAVVTLQLNALDATGEFVGAVDVIAYVPAGYHVAHLDQVKWPQGAISFNPKIWISGTDGASVSLDRMMILRR